TTGVTPDTTRPIVSATVPVTASTAVAINQTITAAFSKAIDPLTITTANFTLKQGTAAVAGTVSYAGVTATFTPASALAPLTTYTARITTGARDLAGNALAADFGWSFTTGATLDTLAPTVSVTVTADGGATTFGDLAASSVANTRGTTVNGDLGLSPGTAVTGFPPGTVNGTIYAADAAAALAQQALTTAYNDAAGRTGAITLAGNLGGQ